MNYGAIWKSDWLIGAVACLLFLAGQSIGLPTLKNPDNLLYDLSVSLNTQPADDRIMLIELDGKASERLSQERIARAIDKLSNAGAKLIALDMLHSEAEVKANPQTEAGKDRLAESIHAAGNVLLPLYFDISSSDNQSNMHAPDYVRRSVIRQVNRGDNQAAPISASMLHHSYNALSEGSSGFGHFNLISDSDGVVRSQPLAITYAGQFYPSISLALAAGAMNIPLSDLRLNLGIDIELGALNVSTDQKLEIYPAFHGSAGNSGYSTYPLSQLLSEGSGASQFKGKIILLGSGADDSTNSFASPLKAEMSRIEFFAHSLQSILKEESVCRPAWAGYIEWLLLLLAGLYLSLLLPRLAVITGLIATAAAIITLLISGLLLISGFSIWIQTALPALLIAIGHLGIGIKQYLIIKEKQPTSASDPHETNKMLGISFQSQGMLEKAFEKFLACPVNDEMLSILYDLALAFERKRQFDEAISVYQRIATHDSSFRDIQTRIISAKNAQEHLSDKDSNSGITSLLASGDNKPTLGRYEIVSELGKGAMGTVYLGKDPKINRQVAIKTLALSKEFEPEQLEEVKERFFHEAEIAGMLNHPNIVTIFDAGDEHDLAYIAMEYLDGIDLIPYTKKGKTLPIPTTLKIIAKVAEALQYAHSHGVIHRDIKPANIMILKNKAVKVTDFGIAHITESNRGKAGTVLGTPSYMSPEQLSGKDIDGRSDLFSLGVMLYEMVAGVRPFKAESISKLMFKIAKEPHVDVREHNPDTPDDVVALINDLLNKKADQRIGSAQQVLERIHQCLHNSSQGGLQ